LESLIKIKILDSNHILINCKINNVNGNFILDSGASNSCINIKEAKKFKLEFKNSNEKASSVNSKIDQIFYSKNNILEIYPIKKNNFEIIVFDMTNVTNSLKKYEIDGIIGGDLLVEFNAIINYEKRELSLQL
tara:strand:- start:170 stop:568 length:399 start_codon:yes stop_codon:yes gene_type:complete